MEPAATRPLRPLAALAMGISLAGVCLGLTLLYLGMREVMEIGGACATGGPYEIATPCPEGVGGLMVGGILGGIAFAFAFAISANRVHPAYVGIVGLFWPALFLSLGWNFLEFGLDAPGPQGAEAGWLVCAVVFFLMGGVPLLVLAARPRLLAGMFWPVSGPPERRGGVREAMRAMPQVRAGATRAAARRPSRPSPPAPEPGSDVVAGLERLAKLRAQGAIDAQEYERAKSIVLGEQP